MSKPSPVAHATFDSILGGVTRWYENAEGQKMAFGILGVDSPINQDPNNPVLVVGKNIPSGSRVHVQIGDVKLVDGTNANMLRKLIAIAKIAIDNGFAPDGLSMRDLEAQAFGTTPTAHDLTPTATTATRSKRRSATHELPVELAPVEDTIVVGVDVEDDDEDEVAAITNELIQDIAIDTAVAASDEDDDDDEYEDEDDDEYDDDKDEE